jgi:hypothetical protein
VYAPGRNRTTLLIGTFSALKHHGGGTARARPVARADSAVVVATIVIGLSLEFAGAVFLATELLTLDPAVLAARGNVYPQSRTGPAALAPSEPVPSCWCPLRRASGHAELGGFGETN